MERSFATHRIRPQEELTGRLWDFAPLQGEHAGEHYTVMTPCCWESLPDTAAYRGEGRYTTSFTGHGNVRIVCKGVSHTATISVDGREVVSHYNAYTPFEVVLPHLPEGKHTLEIVADNRFSDQSALHVPNDYMSYGGVTRPVLVERLGDAYLRLVHVTTRKVGETWQAHVEAWVVNLTERELTVDLTLALSEAGSVEGSECKKESDRDVPGEWKCDRMVSLAPGQETLVSCDLDCAGALPWSPEAPNLYEVCGTLYQEGMPIDDLIDRFGFREIQISGKQILLNGQPLRIKGVCRHEDHPQYGCALPMEAMAYDLMQIRDLGANSVRTAHYPNDERFLDLCDALGILIWEENHARGLSEEQMRNPHFEDQAEEVIREMVPLHYNHPSIYIWGILNECASETEYGKACYEKQLNLIRSLDATRPTSFASCKFKTDICFGLPEVVSYNIYPLWYHNTPVGEYLDDLYTWVQEETEGAGKPFLVTEIGAGGLYGYRNPEHSHWTEEYQAETLREQVTAVLAHPDCVGLYIWQYCDIRISEEWWGGRPRTMNNKGLVDEFRRHKLCYDVVKDLYRKQV